MLFALLVAPHGLLVPRLPLSRRSCFRCKDPVAALPRPVLDPLADAAEKAVTDSTGVGEESSGSGRPEWGTWCDSELFAEVKSCLNRVALHTAEGDAWGGLWEAVGGEAPSGTLRLAAGKQWDLLLHIWSPAQVEGAGIGGGDGEDDALHGRALCAKHADGTLCLLRPLLGRVKISKLRPSGEVSPNPKPKPSPSPDPHPHPNTHPHPHPHPHPRPPPHPPPPPHEGRARDQVRPARH